uniref:Uncharacterized protein n=1 Tax=Phenylobacterium glaciei TaxID=2803784 RepID=A0A974P6V2_9CAUL|nr:hypothetical protein JKL49_12450 [Phenylobacterium glaciei]
MTVQRPWALMRHHAGWADVFHIDSESTDSITGFYPDRETVGPPVTYSVRAILARFETMEAAPPARAQFWNGASTTPPSVMPKPLCATPRRPAKTPGSPA